MFVFIDPWPSCFSPLFDIILYQQPFYAIYVRNIYQVLKGNKIQIPHTVLKPHLVVLKWYILFHTLCILPKWIPYNETHKLWWWCTCISEFHNELIKVRHDIVLLESAMIWNALWCVIVVVHWFALIYPFSCFVVHELLLQMD